MLTVGQQAPDFAAETDEGATFHLFDWAGEKNVVLYFYPGDFTAGCTKQACAFRDNYQAILNEDAVVIGVSVDDQESHRRFRETYALPFPLVADTDREITRKYDAERKLFISGPQRVTYVIDKSGVVRAAFRHELAIGRHQGDALHALRRINGR